MRNCLDSECGMGNVRILELGFRKEKLRVTPVKWKKRIFNGAGRMRDACEAYHSFRSILSKFSNESTSIGRSR